MASDASERARKDVGVDVFAQMFEHIHGGNGGGGVERKNEGSLGIPASGEREALDELSVESMEHDNVIRGYRLRAEAQARHAGSAPPPPLSPSPAQTSAHDDKESADTKLALVTQDVAGVLCIVRPHRWCRAVEAFVREHRRMCQVLACGTLVMARDKTTLPPPVEYAQEDKALADRSIVSTVSFLRLLRHSLSAGSLESGGAVLLNSRRTYTDPFLLRWQRACGPMLLPLCAECSGEARFICSACKTARYCSADHQAAHRNRHKSACKPLSKLQRQIDAATPVAAPKPV